MGYAWKFTFTLNAHRATTFHMYSGLNIALTSNNLIGVHSLSPVHVFIFLGSKWNDEAASPTIGNVYSLLEPFTVKNSLFHTRSHHHVRKDSEAAEDIFHTPKLVS